MFEIWPYIEIRFNINAKIHIVHYGYFGLIRHDKNVQLRPVNIFDLVLSFQSGYMLQKSFALFFENCSIKNITNLILEHFSHPNPNSSLNFLLVLEEALIIAL